MKIPVHIAEKLLQLTQGGKIPSSSAKHPVIEELINEGIIERNGRIQKTIHITKINSLFQYLQNKYGINDLKKYIEVIRKDNSSLSEILVQDHNKLPEIMFNQKFCYDFSDNINSIITTARELYVY